MKIFNDLGSAYSKSFKGFPEGKTVSVETKYNGDLDGKFSAKIQQKNDGAIVAEQTLNETRVLFGQKTAFTAKRTTTKTVVSAKMKDFGKVKGLTANVEVSEGVPSKGYTFVVSDQYVKDNFALTTKTTFEGTKFQNTEITGSYTGLIDTFTIGASTKISSFSVADATKDLKIRCFQDLGDQGEIIFESFGNPLKPTKNTLGFYKKVNDNLSIAAGFENTPKSQKVQFAFKKQLENKQELKVKYDSDNNLSTALVMKPFDNTSVTLGATLAKEKASFAVDFKVSDTL